MPPPKDETEEQKALRLTKAKKNASKAREEAMKKKYRDKILEDEAKKQVKEESEDDDEDDEAPKKPLKPVKEPKPIKEEIVEEEEKPKPKPKAKKPKAKVIIEQSSDDEDTFEASKDVIFVKRVRAKPKAEAPPPQAPQHAQPPPVTRQEQPLPERYQQQLQQQQQQQQPQRAVMTPEKRLEMERYLNMTRGNFLPMSRPR